MFIVKDCAKDINEIRRSASLPAGKKRWRTKAAATSNARIDLMIEKFLDMIYDEKMLAIHGDDGIPDL